MASPEEIGHSIPQRICVHDSGANERISPSLASGAKTARVSLLHYRFYFPSAPPSPYDFIHR